ncbi:hypothetical protein [Microbacterium sp. GXF7504]
MAGRTPDLRKRIIRASFTTEEAVYGVILVAGMIVVSGAHDSTSWQAFLTVTLTVIVFWAAHVYAGTVAHHGLDGGRVVPLGESFRGAVKRSWGLLGSAIIPCLILLFGALDAIPDTVAIWAALWTGCAVLGVLGFIAFTQRGAPLLTRFIGALATAGFGVVVTLLKAFIH